MSSAEAWTPSGLTKGRNECTWAFVAVPGTQDRSPNLAVLRLGTGVLFVFYGI